LKGAPGAPPVGHARVPAAPVAARGTWPAERTISVS